MLVDALHGLKPLSYADSNVLVDVVPTLTILFLSLSASFNL